jgi:hypothetical protein
MCQATLACLRRNPEAALLLEASLSRRYCNGEPVRRWTGERYSFNTPVASAALCGAQKLLEVIQTELKEDLITIKLGEAYLPGPKPRNAHKEDANLIWSQWRMVPPLELAHGIEPIPAIPFAPHVWCFSYPGMVP